MAMAMAKVSLDHAAASSVAANGGYRVVSIVPRLKAGVPVAEVTLMKGSKTKEVSAKLN
jgi:hypothetical protein